jgi:hypothetical protein
MKQLTELDYMPVGWARRLEDEFWITTAADLLSSCLTEGGVERLANTLGAEKTVIEELAERLRQELSDVAAAEPVASREMGLLPPQDDERGDES